MHPKTCLRVSYELDVHSALERDLAWGSCQARLTDLVGTETMIPCNIQIAYYSRDSKSKRSKCAIFLGPLFNRAAAEQKGLDTTPGMVGHPGAEKPILAADKPFSSLQLYPKWEWDRKTQTLSESRWHWGAIWWQPPRKASERWPLLHCVSSLVFQPRSVWRDCCALLGLVAQTLCNPMDCILPGSSVHGILQAGILE